MTSSDWTNHQNYTLANECSAWKATAEKLWSENQALRKGNTWLLQVLRRWSICRSRSIPPDRELVEITKDLAFLLSEEK